MTAAAPTPESKRVVLLNLQEKAKARNLMITLGHPEPDVARILELADGGSLEACLDEAKKWMTLSERNDTVRDAVAAGFLLNQIKKTFEFEASAPPAGGVQ